MRTNNETPLTDFILLRSGVSKLWVSLDRHDIETPLIISPFIILQFLTHPGEVKSSHTEEINKFDKVLLSLVSIRTNCFTWTYHRPVLFAVESHILSQGSAYEMCGRQGDIFCLRVLVSLCVICRSTDALYS
jgi:hypothetical protein